VARVAREMVEKAGIDVDELLKLLVKNAAAELTTFYYYTILRANLIGKVLVAAERCAVHGYTNICNLTAGKDHRTYGLAQAILNEEIEHESWFSEFLGEGPSGHFLRRGETSPFVGPYMR